MSEFVLSICFNYYKRFESTKHVIESLLQSKDERLQLAVYDDSADSQMETFLSSIGDRRLKLVKSSSEHVGMVQGMVECISIGDGIYSMYATEMEMFDYKKISVLIDDLERSQNVAAGCSDAGFSGACKIYKKGIDAVSNIAIRFVHPVGFFFKVSEYKKIDYMKYCEAAKYVNFPLDFLMGELLASNDGMMCESVWYGTNDYVACQSEEKSFSTVNEEDAWFMLNGREKLLKNAIDFIEQLPLGIPEKSRLLLRQFDTCAEGVSVSLKWILSKETLCRHYCMKSRYLDLRQYSYNLAHVYGFFCRNIPAKYHKALLGAKALKMITKYLLMEI